MLAHITIENIAVIESAQVEFYDGLNVLTGETGAGKSIIIDSIGMVLGQRTSRDLIRSGKTKARVSALFYPDDATWALLEKLGVERSEDSSLLIFREISQDGRGNCKINGVLTPISTLKEVGKFLINIHGQQDTTVLYSPDKHISLLDSWAGKDLEAALSSYRELYHQYKDLLHRRDRLKENESSRMREIDMLQYQIEEISQARLSPGEDEELQQRAEILENAEEISDALDFSYESLFSEEDNARDRLFTASKKLQEIAQYEEGLEQLSDQLTELCYQLDDIGSGLSGYRDQLDFDPSELNEINERLDVIRTLKRKYGNTIEDILIFLEEAEKKLELLSDSSQSLDSIESALELLLPRLKKEAAQLHAIRQTKAQQLEKCIEKELEDLNMPGARFQVVLSSLSEYGSRGTDSVEFYISANPGETPKPLAKIASGGELSRIMLAMKVIMAAFDRSGTYVFDEIDTGVSGRAAEKVARKLRQVSALKQTLVITHSPHIAAIAQHHYLIEKQVTDQQTLTTLTLLDKQGRIEEIARINSGSDLTPAALLHAKELLEHAQAQP